jgi:hypothetical protein
MKAVKIISAEIIPSLFIPQKDDDDYDEYG